MSKSEQIEKIELGSNDVKARFDLPRGEAEGAILLLPGISSGPFGGIFDQFAEKAKEENFMVMRYESWENLPELQEKTMDSIIKEINEALEYLESLDTERTYLVAKSFSAGMILAGKIDRADKITLWAPAIGFQEKSNIEELREKRLGGIDDVTDIKIDSEYIKQEVPVKIIHGVEDEVVPVANSESIVSGISEAEIEKLMETGHAYEGKENALIRKTIEFLNQ
ncbi:alpha/beta hydrolase [Candidatus Nanohalococcus occultus]|uniref:Alpha/beta hydrolase n=1 Tax=Candidatus Nanohalococcus occultus TaxID=2978047 RepID=A0ABY8CEA0_9ARCH|nr:hypothetical protein SVXNc_0492 [Candidatus Nanohaloarchaeota archaeon SVXNc]